MKKPSKWVWLGLLVSVILTIYCLSILFLGFVTSPLFHDKYPWGWHDAMFVVGAFVGPLFMGRILRHKELWEDQERELKKSGLIRVSDDYTGE